jgi:hypothetical protein
MVYAVRSPVPASYSRRALVSSLLLGSSFRVFGGAVVASTAMGIKRSLSGDWVTSAGTLNPQQSLQHDSVLSTIGKTPLIRLNRCPRVIVVQLACAFLCSRTPLYALRTCRHADVETCRSRARQEPCAKL